MEYENELINDEDLIGDASNDNVESSVSESSGSQPNQVQVEALSLDELNKYLGKNYPNKESALKSLKDTFSYVGKKKESVVKEAFDENKFISREQYEEDMFFSRNPEYTTPEMKEIIKSMAKADGIRPSDVVEKDSFKKVFGAVKGYSESQNLKSVLETNPRIAQTKSLMKEAQEARMAGNKPLAEQLAVKAVMDAYEM